MHARFVHEESRPVSRRRSRWIATALAALLALLVALPAILAEPIRFRIESGVNRSLTGYRVSIGALALHPLALRVELRDLVVVQGAHPEPPVAVFPRFAASVHWRALLTGNLVGDLELLAPRLHLNLAQLREEAGDRVKVQDRGWQQALREIYPLEINELVVEDGSLTYLDVPDATPLEITDVSLLATNIRNVRSPERTYPSELRLRAKVFDEGSLALQGRADFLAEPHPGLRVKLDLGGVPLGALAPVTRHWNAAVRSGVLSARGSLELAPDRKAAHLQSAFVTGLDADLLLSRARTGDAEELIEKVGETIDELGREPSFFVRVDSLAAHRSKLGVVNRDADPEYRLFVSADRLHLRELTNHPGGPRSRLEMDGLFLDSGPTRLRASFLPTARSADFEMNLAIRDTDLRKLNPVWRAHAGLDVAGGKLSFFSQLEARDGRVDGYVKPILASVDVYDREQDADENVFQQLYEGIVGGASEIFQNQPRDTVAARTDVSGPIANPQTSTLQLVFSILRNAFIDAILPGLEHRAGRSER